LGGSAISQLAIIAAIYLRIGDGAIIFSPRTSGNRALFEQNHMSAMKANRGTVGKSHYRLCDRYRPKADSHGCASIRRKEKRTLAVCRKETCGSKRLYALNGVSEGAIFSIVAAIATSELDLCLATGHDCLLTLTKSAPYDLLDAN